MNQRFVLIVEDDARLAKLVKKALERDGTLKAEIVGKGLDALWTAAEHVPDIVILDLGLPDVDGTEVCRSLRSRQPTAHVPIIIVSERASEQDKLVGFNLGADDYVTKPFSIAELQARVRVALRRGQSSPARLNSYKGRLIAANFNEGLVSVAGKRINLTRREFDLLWYLVEHREQVIPPDRLRKAVWGDVDLGDSRTLVTHIARLRAKLGSAGNQIHTFMRKGYIFSEDPDIPPREP